ncbi:MAG: hypothetical protein E7381_05270 [Clostridiales bacterium]|nr:hypothetical protein [Clostridiales bacterium]
MPISKTDFVRALQCEKMLWLDAHRPDLKMIPPEVQARLEQGNAFGDDAMGIFGAFKETTAYREDGRLDFAKMIENTKTLLEEGERVICEGSFSWYGNFCAVDILKKEKNGYALYEVKNAPAPREEFLLDLAFQSFILRKCGIKILSASLILNGEPTETDFDFEGITHNGRAYKIVTVSSQTRERERLVSDNIFPFGKIKKKDAVEPTVPVGERCEKPYRCWYFEHCHNHS